MDTRRWLAKNNEETLSTALKTFGRTQNQFKLDIRTIKDWMKTQHHLPEISSDHQIMNFLLVNKCSIEQTKQKLDMYYTIRQLMPEIYENSNMNSARMKKVSNELYFFPLPKRTEEGHRVSVAKMLSADTENFDFYQYLGYGFNSLEVRIQEDVIFEDIFIIDFENVKLSHIFKVSPFQLKKMVTILEKVYSNKIRQFHFVNCPTFALNAINLMKQLIKPKLAQRVFVHEGVDTLSNNISLKVLPKDYGGLDLPLHELNQMWQIKLAEYKERFNVIDKLKTNEMLRPAPLKNDEILGYHGNFRKLEMD
ncbi:unnamed protein product [Phyllotreta striolata]|uniref:CRAL-TRIO domain-containing protein n=1 Tax=Phyllotreta striolata TaxID=444603 RepID=A0A9N9XP06_PHYSR|nr:unnamed protein product [Phyllotreta striolata]